MFGKVLDKTNPALKLILSAGLFEVLESEQKGKIYKKRDELVIFFGFSKISLNLVSRSKLAAEA